MAKKTVPTAAEVREYLEKEDAYMKDCIANHKTYVITGPNWPGFDIKGYYYCLALISLSDYRKEDCEKQLWTTIDQFFKNDPGLENIPTLLRDMKVLGSQRAVLKDMRNRIEEEISKRKTK